MKTPLIPLVNCSNNLNFSYVFSRAVLETFARQELFEADFTCKTHFSQHPYLLGIKNKFYFYDIEKSLFLFSNAVRFLREIDLKTNVNFVFAGSPKDQEKKIAQYFTYFSFPCRFFPNELWHSGSISKSALDKDSVLIIYNIRLNSTAIREAVCREIPVVGFATPSCDIRGVDYPILLNFKKLPIIYLKVLASIFGIEKVNVTKSRRSQISRFN